jgi:site-specific DNA-cytosine methylase
MFLLRGRRNSLRFPCQPFSAMGMGNGIRDLRGVLIFRIVDIVRALLPSAFVLENVEGLMTRHKDGQKHFHSHPCPSAVQKLV